MMAWLLLVLSIGFEVLAATLLKLSTTSHDQSWAYAGGVLVSYGACFYFMQLAMRHWDLGVMYAIWAGAGVVLVTAIGIMAFGDALTLQKTLSVVLIVLGIVGLNLSGAH